MDLLLVGVGLRAELLKQPACDAAVTAGAQDGDIDQVNGVWGALDEEPADRLAGELYEEGLASWELLRVACALSVELHLQQGVEGLGRQAERRKTGCMHVREQRFGKAEIGRLLGSQVQVAG